MTQFFNSNGSHFLRFLSGSPEKNPSITFNYKKRWNSIRI